MAFKKTVVFSALVVLLAVTGNGPTGAGTCGIMDTVYDNLKVAMYNMSEDMMRMKGDWQLCMDMYTQYTNGQMDLPSLLRALQNMQSTQSDLYNHMLSYTVQGNNMQMTMSSNIINTYIVI